MRWCGVGGGQGFGDEGSHSGLGRACRSRGFVLVEMGGGEVGDGVGSEKAFPFVSPPPAIHSQPKKLKEETKLPLT